ncbi:MAG: hypothetical protein D6B25_00305 [Desulfobulbaceae bacterium]|nr:MAG: hypothetical protein D6B25_00305 [Desulfobulbaceae bacterium]
MIEGFYSLLEAVGFTHPLHPVIVHVPMGMAIASVAFMLAHFKWSDKNFAQSAFHANLLGLLFVVPVYIAGLLDWQQWFGGDLTGLIIVKMIFGVILTIALAYGVWIKTQGASEKKLLITYLAILGISGVLGYSGGELLYGG